MAESRTWKNSGKALKNNMGKFNRGTEMVPLPREAFYEKFLDVSSNSGFNTS
jgi:hypothetical protein